MLIKNPRSDAELLREATAQRKAWKAGLYSATCLEAGERPSKRGNDMIETVWAVSDGEGNVREHHDYFTDTPVAALKLRHCCEATDCLAQYEAGEVRAEMFPGREVTVQLGVEKRRGYPERNIILDYRPATSHVVTPLRNAG